MKKNFLETVKEKTVFFDGAMGTILMKEGLSSIDIPETLNLENPSLVIDIHRQYFESGSDVVSTNTFGANPLKLSAHGLEKETELLNRQGAQIAKQACPEGRFVAGDIGPTGKMIKPFGEISQEEMEDIFHLQAKGLMSGGVDLIIIETMFSLQEAVAAITGAKRAGDMVVVASMTYKKTKRGFFTLMGEDTNQCSASLEDAGADVIGTNCTLGSAGMIDLTRALKASTGKPVLIQPNAGKPVVRDGITFYEQSPAEFALDVEKIREAGADIIGGCCGTSPEFIRAASGR